jgi:hypothetical protein
MKNNELWFSHALYLNDPLEIAFGPDVIINILNMKKNDYTTALNIIEKQRNNYKEYSLDLNRNLVSLFSFSEPSDKLSSWIQYSDSGHSVCLEFIRPILLKNISTYTTGLRGDIFFPIQYFSSEFLPHSNNIDGFNEVLFGYYKGMEDFIKKERMEKEPNAQRTLYETTKSIACFIKNDFHASEKEWWYAIFSGRGDNDIILKQANHGIKMFYKVSFGEENIIYLINSIITGPKHNRVQKIVAALEILIYQTQATMYNIHFSQGMLRS